jgi:tRNA (cytidine/uridine-2'-O-)-methyltransferase
MKIILFQPDIPQNTGNIVRTCSVTNTKLGLVPPLGFSIASRHLKRAGLDYWNEVDIEMCEDLEGDLSIEESPFYFFSSKAKKPYTEINFTNDTILIFGSETKGLPPSYFERWPDRFYTIPMATGSRCLNLSNSVSIVLFEGLRQLEFTFA